MIIRVNGRSMLPTLTHGQFMVVDRKYGFEKIDSLASIEDLTKRIFVIWSPDDVPIIKRLVYISSTDQNYYWFEGDNPEESLDSRQWGFLFSGGFIGEAIGFKEAFKRLFKKRRE